MGWWPSWQSFSNSCHLRNVASIMQPGAGLIVKRTFFDILDANEESA